MHLTDGDVHRNVLLHSRALSHDGIFTLLCCDVPWVLSQLPAPSADAVTFSYLGQVTATVIIMLRRIHKVLL